MHESCSAWELFRFCLIMQITFNLSLKIEFMLIQNVCRARESLGAPLPLETNLNSVMNRNIDCHQCLIDISKSSNDFNLTSFKDLKIFKIRWLLIWVCFLSLIWMSKQSWSLGCMLQFEKHIFIYEKYCQSIFVFTQGAVF